jgi:hypothetical protein
MEATKSRIQKSRCNSRGRQKAGVYKHNKTKNRCRKVVSQQERCRKKGSQKTDGGMTPPTVTIDFRPCRLGLASEFSKTGQALPTDSAELFAARAGHTSSDAASVEADAMAWVARGALPHPCLALTMSAPDQVRLMPVLMLVLMLAFMLICLRPGKCSAD